MRSSAYDAVVVGSGPNGLAAAITLVRGGRSVLVLEAADTVGGGMRSAELTLPGFVHDVCSAVHPLGLASPFFRSVPLGEFGLEWVHPAAPLAHPFDDGTAAVLERSIEATCRTLRDDARAYQRLMAPLVGRLDALLPDLLAPIFPPRHPFSMARFGLLAMRSARSLAMSTFTEERTMALFAGLAAHALVPLEAPFTASFGLTLGMLAHAVGWPVARGGSGKIAAALAAYLESLGGEIATGTRVSSANDLPSAKAVFFDTSPRLLLDVGVVAPGYRRRLERYRYGHGAFKLDWALDGPIPWSADECARAGTVHLGGTLEEIAASEKEMRSERPFVLLAQPSLFDPTRAPAGKHTAWAYCHVPNGSTTDMTQRIEQQVERFAPGFRRKILARHVMSPVDFQSYNPSYIGGDIVGGSNEWRQILARPRLLHPYEVPRAAGPPWFLCSASTPPGGGVHGMCGYNAASRYLASQ